MIGSCLGVIGGFLGVIDSFRRVIGGFRVVFGMFPSMNGYFLAAQDGLPSENGDLRSTIGDRVLAVVRLLRVMEWAGRKN